MDGLNAVELSLKEMQQDNEKFRIDSEFFKKEYLKTYSFIKNEKNGIELQTLLSVLTDFSSNGSYKSIADNFELLDEEDYAYMVRTTDLEKEDYVTDVKYISEHSYNFLSKSKVYGGELLINKIGCPGKTYLMPTLNKPVSLGMNLLMIRLKEDNYYTSEFLWAYFHSKYGKNMIYRKVNGTVPQTIDKEAIRSLFVPETPKLLVDIITELVKKHEVYVKKYTNIYDSLILNLYKDLGFDEEKLCKDNYSIRSLNNSFVLSGRLDSEYYLKKYDSLFDFIKTKKYDLLDNLVKIIKSNEPGSMYYSEDEGVPFVRVAELTKYDVAEPELKLDSSIYDMTKNKIPNKGDILFSKDGSVGIAYYIFDSANYAVASSILQLSVKNKKLILPQYLTLVLNSKIVKLQSIRDTGGSIINHWSPDEIKKVMIPILPMDKQIELSKKYDEACQEVINSKKASYYAIKLIDIFLEQGLEACLEFEKTIEF